ncbi:class I SAM-dependent methyltransferase [Xanthobacter pseudotagetidis]|uniref:class I SAM-dependent methyltransferase n=1 Tax=Xanthobacter pseudotagetidis TaxID=3119911 RepID=UPI00372C4AC6
MSQHSKLLTASTTFDAASADYAKEVNEAIAFLGLDAERFAEAKAKRLIELARAQFANPALLKVLDLGCGIGMFHRHLAGAFGELHGLDVSSSSIAIARAANLWCSYAVYDGTRAPYADGTFDLIFTACVIHHVPPEGRRAFADEMRRMLRPGGLVVVFEHNPFNPLTRLGVARCPFDADAVLISPNALRRLMVGAKFKDARARSLFTLPPLTPAMIRLDRLFAALPLGAQYEVTARVGA